MNAANVKETMSIIDNEVYDVSSALTMKNITVMLHKFDIFSLLNLHLGLKKTW